MSRIQGKTSRSISQRTGPHWIQDTDIPRMIRMFFRLANRCINKLLNSKVNSSSSSVVGVRTDTVGLRGLPSGKIYHNTNYRLKSRHWSEQEEKTQYYDSMYMSVIEFRSSSIISVLTRALVDKSPEVSHNSIQRRSSNALRIRQTRRPLDIVES